MVQVTRSPLYFIRARKQRKVEAGSQPGPEGSVTREEGIVRRDAHVRRDACRKRHVLAKIT